MPPVGVVDRYLGAFWSEGDLAVAEEIFTDDIEFYSAGYPEGLFGKDAISQLVSNVRRIVSDLCFAEIRRWTDGTTVVSHYSSHGTRGQWMSLFQLEEDRIRRIDAFEGR